MKFKVKKGEFARVINEHHKVTDILASTMPDDIVLEGEPVTNKTRKMEFRAWDTEDKIMLNWQNRLAVSFLGSPFYKDDLSVESREYVAQRFILMQSTGLLDCNNREIFEGDIVQQIGTYMKPSPVIYKVGTASFRVNGSHLDLLHHENHSLEVIGNIYENPKLSSD